MEQPQQNKRQRTKLDPNNPFPFNFRQYYPNIPSDTIKSSLKNPNSLIKVISYNILCDSLLPTSTKILESEMNKLPFLSWESRRSKLWQEWNQWNGDILCLIEIERDETLITNLVNSGYEYTFKPRTGNHSEGCALAWKDSRWHCLEILCIEYNMNKTNKDISPIYNRDNIGIIGVFELKGVENTIVISAVTHLLFNCHRGDIKLGQIYQWTQSMNIWKTKYETLGKSVSIIIGGDFNAIPNSAVYKLLTQGTLFLDYIDKNRLSGQDPENWQYIDPQRIRQYWLKKITTVYKEPLNASNNNNNNYFNSKIDNSNWFNDILHVQPVIDNGIIEWKYNESHRYIQNNLSLNLPIVFKSAYSTWCKDIFEYWQNSDIKGKEIPFSLLGDWNELDNIEINGIKVSRAEIDKTLSFSKLLTLDIPMGSYGNNSIGNTDYIMYHGNNIKCVKILNIPNINEIVFDIGFLPSKDFPSDHFSLVAEFVIGE